MVGVLCAGCVVEAQPYGYAPVPPLRVEAPPPLPGPLMVWQHGGWDWLGDRYVWHPGHYVAVRPHRERWIAGHWAYRGGRPFWVPGHWG